MGILLCTQEIATYLVIIKYLADYMSLFSWLYWLQHSPLKKKKKKVKIYTIFAIWQFDI